MRVNVISDLHLEFGDLTLPGGDVLIISGDACESRTLKKYPYDPSGMNDDHGHEKRWDRAARFFAEETVKYRECIYVMGNHEHYHGRLDKTHGELSRLLPKTVTLLENQTHEIDGVLFMGATLWTDCNRASPLSIQALQQGMNDYRSITFRHHNVYRKLTPRDTMEQHAQTKAYFQSVVDDNPGRKIVVATHHAPSYASVAEHWKHDVDFNGGYASDLSEFILDNPEIKFWTHGHMHDPCSYMIGDCRIICNPRGYYGHEQQARDFDPTVGFDI
jgi:Calcineurin-like phosphoesterase